MKKFAIVTALAAALIAGSAAGAQYGFARGQFSGFGGLQWESNCRKPRFPSAEYADEFQAESTTRDYRRYTDCLAEQAPADSQYAANQVVEEAQDELDEVKSDARRAGWNIR